jgi:hypothetical protein
MRDPSIAMIPQQRAGQGNHDAFVRKEQSSFKNGQHATFYMANRNRYFGEWQQDKMHGGGGCRVGVSRRNGHGCRS